MHKHLYRSEGRSRGGKSNLFRCLKCEEVIAVKTAPLHDLIKGKALRMRNRNINKIKEGVS